MRGETVEAIGVEAQPGVPAHDGAVEPADADAEYTVPPRMGRSTGSGLYLFVEDVGAIFAAAVDSGATGVFAPETTAWRTQRARLDPEGHEWSFGTYEPGGSW